jgi:hypothetical protein
MATVRISTSLLHRLDACVEERRRWRELFGDGLVAVDTVVADVAIRAPLNVGWFLLNTCGEKTLRAITEVYLDGVIAEWQSRNPPERWVFDVEGGDWKAIVGNRHFDESEEEFRRRERLRNAGSYLAHARRCLRNDQEFLLAPLAGAHHAAYLLSERGLREVPIAAAALAGAIDKHSRVINRSIALAGIK